uniref:Solute carrier family 40 member n=1 Tax=Schizophyllum commune (strain H4-8 / FGSC 9210) TaxID=578458 RepID=D8QH90_SCHCM
MVASERGSLEAPLLSDPAAQYSNATATPPSPPSSHGVPWALRKRLYVSHFLSTWNSRVFEFGAVLYLASIYPGTLLPMSVYALSRQVSTILFSPFIGRYIDRNNRLKVVRMSIVLQRITVTVSCVVFFLLSTGWGREMDLQYASLAVLAALACIEKLCAVMNMVSVERDWVRTEHHLHLLHHSWLLNAQMRRIDLICKLAGPFLISILDGVSTEIAILVNLGMNLASVLVEYFAIARVYKSVPALQQPKIPPPTSPTSDNSPSGPSPRRTSYCPVPALRALASALRALASALRALASDLRTYFTHRAVLPSFAGALLYLTVLSFSAQMVTYLLAAGLSPLHIAAARTVSVACELSATWLAPLVMRRIGPVRTGIWFVSWQCVCLAAGTSAFWSLRATNARLGAAALVAGSIISRVGLWGYDLSAQVIIQEEVEAEHRGTFATVEASWQSAFELCAYGSTVVFSRPEQFRWPALMSCAAVFSAGGLYALFVRKRRGHLLHLSKCIEHRSAKRRNEREGYERLVQSPEF